MIPAPNGGSPGASLFNDSPIQPTNWREELVRVDHNLTDKQRLTFRYIHDSWDDSDPCTVVDEPGQLPDDSD